jgi:glutamate N-acetyltransferase/amino-acid N-acetyltransferase
MTTDTQKKEIAIEFESTDGKTIKVGGMCKGSGMIHPNMATMIGVVTTDANIPADLLQETLSSVVEHTFNRTSVDGDTSVCDCVTLLANGCSDSVAMTRDSEDYAKFVEVFDHICTYLARNTDRLLKGNERATSLRSKGSLSSL